MLDQLIDLDRWLLLAVNGSTSLYFDGLVKTLTTAATWIPLYLALFYLVMKNNNSVAKYFFDYPNIAGPDQENPEYGWHRVGFRYHVELIEGKTGEELTDYIATVTGYVDGVAIFKTDQSQSPQRVLGFVDAHGEPLRP